MSEQARNKIEDLINELRAIEAPFIAIFDNRFITSDVMRMEPSVVAAAYFLQCLTEDSEKARKPRTLFIECFSEVWAELYLSEAPETVEPDTLEKSYKILETIKEVANDSEIDVQITVSLFTGESFQTQSLRCFDHVNAPLFSKVFASLAAYKYDADEIIEKLIDLSDAGAQEVETVLH